ncbi:LysR substrate-binding domain-containing protein [Endozoicomonas sp. GU-1]|uniref:LysR substrate-binding domain-containing protein n=1 Tax=Endozoicomonas sp. GU-1 TaxID=3009078 RepID=UPI0022B32583|nr:LysR substrate-binding domain-containing protein [Endozoicomonas sp. GU-1]WBA81796.1 LysR substrate-binding domain-containing protein [Endozoicomonas sp. GU-1]WBA84751.1 LysR substrate-binding domain-containing protein [Endozoicomonas sp. GU-1]
MHITLRQLEIFRAVAQYARVTGAAESLHISQPAASMALSELEKHLGPLFDRNQGAGLKMNDSGRALLPKASELIDRAKELENQFAGDGSYESGSLVLNASSTIGNNLLPKMLARFRESYPGIRIDLEIDNTRVIEQRLLDFNTDLAVVEGVCLHPDIEVTTWLEDELVIICSPDHPLANKGNIPLSSLANELWVLREPGSGTRELFDEMIATQLSSPKVAMVLNRSEAVKQAVSDGVGIACISSLAAKSTLDTGHMATIGVTGLNLKRHFYLLTHKRKYKSTVFTQLCQFILASKPFENV